ncbi:MAG: hypothetical protein KC613_13905 [Myxococcales bacterium]|nr:hypothetical protein [Myxococcales bacterium]MCB9522009.1 hypothetical protein [Myxococcales bacterium]
MNALGPLYGVGITVDARLFWALALANGACALGAVLLLFRGRPTADRLWIALGVFFTLELASLAGLRAFARTPIRDLQVFVVD